MQFHEVVLVEVAQIAAGFIAQPGITGFRVRELAQDAFELGHRSCPKDLFNRPASDLGTRAHPTFGRRL
jgi:hypothetical protein